MQDRLEWLAAQLKEIDNERLQAAAFVVAAPVLWRKLGGRLSQPPWELSRFDAELWSSSERGLFALALGLVDGTPIGPEFVASLSILDQDEAASVRSAIAVATGADPLGQLARLIEVD
jgi:hypothetical protein